MNSIGLGSAFAKSLYTDHQISRGKIRGVSVQCLSSRIGVKASKTYEYEDNSSFVKRRDAIGLVIGVSSLFINSFGANAAGLPPEEKPKICDDACEKELENVW